MRPWSLLPVHGIKTVWKGSFPSAQGLRIPYDDPEEDNIIALPAHLWIEVIQNLLSFLAIQEWRRAIKQKKTRYPAYPILFKMAAAALGAGMGLPLLQPFLRSPGSNRPESGAPTRAVWKYTSHGYFQASEDRSFQSFPARTLTVRILKLQWPFAISSMRTNHCCFTIGSTVVLQRSWYLHCGNGEPPLPEVPDSLSPLPWLFLPRSGPCQSMGPVHFCASSFKITIP